jgi:hypothetical protein
VGKKPVPLLLLFEKVLQEFPVIGVLVDIRHNR